ncbi:MAG: glycosyl transferase family 1 [Bacteroidetes bacterium]|nr:MAG: glycosyl transferase family 1 [Bacteroidota bacterium]
MEHRFIKNRDIVLFSFQAWESDIAFNFKDMAYELARHNRVLFVNRALDRNSILKNAFDNKPRQRRPPGKGYRHLQQIQEEFWLLNPRSVLESINWSPSQRLFDYFNRINNRRLAEEINRAIDLLSFSDIIFINDNDFFRGVYQKELVPCDRHIFYIRDYLTIQPFFKKYGPGLEKKMFEIADMVVANSSYLAEYAKKWNRNSYDIGQGCHLENFVVENLPQPRDLASIPKPIIGYCGAVTSMRLDSEVIEHIATSLPECSVVLVGPTDEYFDKKRFQNLKNIYLLGGKQPKEIPDYVYHFDICINPQLVNQLTIGNYPRKIDEYLAAGKPVVATMTDAMEMFGKYTFLCKNKEDYVQQIKTIFSNKDLLSDAEIMRRRNFALDHTWENSIGLLGDAFYQEEAITHAV